MSAERAWPGVGGTHRSVAAEEKQNAERQERAAGGASGAHKRGGTANTAASVWLAHFKRDGLFSKDPAVRHRLTVLKLLPSLVVILRFNRLFPPSAQVSQLRHDLSMKDELLQFYTNAAEESEGESVTSTPWVSSPLHPTRAAQYIMGCSCVSRFSFKAYKRVQISLPWMATTDANVVAEANWQP